MALNRRQQLFADEYLIDLNAQAAYLRAGYAKRGAGQSAHALLKHTEVAGYITAELSKRKITQQLSVEATHDEVRALAHSDPRSLFREDGRPKMPHEWSDEAARCVAGFEVTETWKPGETRDDEPYLVVVTKLKLWPKDNVLGLKAKIQKLVTDVHEVKYDDGTADKLAKARERAKNDAAEE